MSFQLVRLQIAIDHLNEDTANASKVMAKLEQASGMVMTRMGYSDIPDGQYDDSASPPILNPAYYDTTVSPPSLEVSDDIQSATLLLLGELWENREGSISQAISESVESILELHYDPPFA